MVRPTVDRASRTSGLMRASMPTNLKGLVCAMTPKLAGELADPAALPSQAGSPGNPPAGSGATVGQSDMRLGEGLHLGKAVGQFSEFSCA